MPTQAEILDQVSKLLQEGKVQEADDLAKSTAAADREASAKATGTPAPPPPPRSSFEVTNDLLAHIVNHLGNPPRLHALLVELEAAAKQK